MMYEINSLETLEKVIKEYIITEKWDLLPRAKWCQIVILYETNDYGIFRTEGAEEMNVESITLNGKQITVPVLLGRKLRAIHRRAANAMFRNTRESYNCKIVTVEGGVSGLCGKCPPCFLWGAVTEKVAQEQAYNIQARAYYSAYFAAISERLATTLMTLNAVDDLRKITGTALTSQQHIVPEVMIPAIFSLYSCTWRETILMLKAVNRARRVGARSTIEGLIIPHPIGLILGTTEFFTPLELSKHLLQKFGDKKIISEEAAKCLTEYVMKAESTGGVVITGDFLRAAESKSDKELSDELFDNEIEWYKEILEINNKDISKKTKPSKKR